MAYVTRSPLIPVYTCEPI